MNSLINLRQMPKTRMTLIELFKFSAHIPTKHFTEKLRLTIHCEVLRLGEALDLTWTELGKMKRIYGRL